MGYAPTDEQAAITDAAKTGANLVIEAGAGAGKTSTLKMIAADAGRVQYIAYNRAIKDEAAASFPGNTLCTTAHGMAYKPVATRYTKAGRKVNGRIVPPMEVARILGIREPVWITDGKAPLAPQQLARIAEETVKRFCKSGDEEVQRRHVPRINGLTDNAVDHATLAAAVVPFARRAWDDITDLRGKLRFLHDHYLKIFSLQKPALGVDLLLVDEAQDLNPAVKAIVDAQQCQVVLVGDRNQAINGWNGAVDAMETFDGQRLYLSQSFRFGDAIAAEANKWLTILGADLRLRGFDKVDSRVESLEFPDAILCRTNATALSRVIAAVKDGRRVALVGGGSDITSLAEAARDLQNGRRTDHRELMAFSSWREVQLYAEDDAGSDNLKTLVRLVDSHGADELIRVLRGLVDEKYGPDLVVSTAHKSKGREWDTVEVADDFAEPKATEKNPDPEVSREAAMLAYVTVTRAKKVLDRSGLAWVDDWLPGPVDAAPAAAEPVAEVIEVTASATADVVDGDAEAEVSDLDLEALWVAEHPETVDEFLAKIDDIPEISDAELDALFAADQPAPVEPTPAPTSHLHACSNPVCAGDHLSPDTDCSQPGWVDMTASGVALAPNCRRCTHHYTRCTCRLMPDRRPIAVLTAA